MPPPHLTLRRLLGGAAVAATLFAAGPARAQSDDDIKRGAALFDQGVAAMKDGAWAKACGKLDESRKIAPRPNVLFNLAQCEEHEGRLVSARKHWREGQAALDSKDERVKIARDCAATLDRRIPTLSLTLPADAPPDARIAVDGADVDRTSLSTPFPLDPGPHVVALLAPGRRESRMSGTLEEGVRKEWSLVVGAKEEGTVPPALSPKLPAKGGAVPVTRVASGPAGRRTAGFVVGGVGLAGFIVAGVTGGLLLSKQSTLQTDCPVASMCSATGLAVKDGAGALFAANYAGWGVGIAGVVTGAVLLITSRGAEARRGPWPSARDQSPVG